jgi:enamine deaminase RidA (YjgF/YER057c/UK114 family)
MRIPNDLSTERTPRTRVVRRRLLTGAGAALVAGQLATSGAAPAATTARRRDLFYYWESAQHSLGYSQGVQVGDTVWLSGTAALDQDFTPVSPGDLAAQMSFIYQRIGESLAKLSLDFRHVVRENMYVTDMAALIEALPFRKSIYGDGPFPTSTTVQVSRLLLPELAIEIEVTAYRA